MATNQLVLKTADICDIRDIEEARATIKPYIRETPLIQSMFLSRNVAHGHVYLKLENMQLTGSFKFRGANNKINHLTPEQRAKERHHYSFSRQSCARGCIDREVIRD